MKERALLLPCAALGSYEQDHCQPNIPASNAALSCDRSDTPCTILKGGAIDAAIVFMNPFPLEGGNR